MQSLIDFVCVKEMVLNPLGFNQAWVCELFNPIKLLRTGNVCSDMGNTYLSTAILWESILVFLFSGIAYSGVHTPFSCQCFNF